MAELTLDTLAPYLETAVDLTALGTDGYLVVADLGEMYLKLGSSTISNYAGPSGEQRAGQNIVFSFTDGDPPGGSPKQGGRYTTIASTGWSFDIDVGTAEKEAWIYFGAFGPSQTTITATLSDGSASPVSSTYTGATGNIDNTVAHIIFAAGSSGQTLTIEIENTGGDQYSTFSGAAVAAGAAPDPATAVIVTGPTSGLVGVASGNFTVSADGAISGDLEVTPSAATGTFTPTSVTINSGSPTGTFTYTPASAGAKTISFDNDGGLTDPADKTYTAVSAVAYDDSHIIANRFSWHDTGTAIVAVNMRSSIRFGFQGTSLSLLLEAATDGAGTIQYSIDHGPIESADYQDVSLLQIATGLSDADHQFEMWVATVNPDADRWDGPDSAFSLKGVVLGAGKALIDSDVAVRPLWVVYGDSTTAQYDSTNHETGTNSWASIAAAGLNLELAQIAFTLQGYASGGAGNVPSTLDAWDFYYDGASRLSGGAFIEQPDYISSVQGINSGANQADVEAHIDNIATAAPGTIHFLHVPMGGNSRANITAAYNAKKATHPELVLVDYGATLEIGMVDGPTQHLWDFIHPTPLRHAEEGAAFAHAFLSRRARFTVTID